MLQRALTAIVVTIIAATTTDVAHADSPAYFDPARCFCALTSTTETSVLIGAFADGVFEVESAFSPEGVASFVVPGERIPTGDDDVRVGRALVYPLYHPDRAANEIGNDWAIWRIQTDGTLTQTAALANGRNENADVYCSVAVQAEIVAAAMVDTEDTCPVALRATSDVTSGERPSGFLGCAGATPGQGGVIAVFALLALGWARRRSGESDGAPGAIRPWR